MIPAPVRRHSRSPRPGALLIALSRLGVNRYVSSIPLCFREKSGGLLAGDIYGNTTFALWLAISSKWTLW